MNEITDNQKLINELSPVYFPNELNIATTLFVPISKVSERFDCLSGYFSSYVLAELAEPLSILFRRPASRGRFIVSPNLSEDDKNALLEAYSHGSSIHNYLFDEEKIEQDAFLKSTLQVMKYLITHGRLDIRIAVLKKGMMHAKIWMFETKWGQLAVHGSGNATKSGLLTNFEQLVFTREWESISSKQIITAYTERFQDFWNDKRPDSYTLKLNDKTLAAIVSKVKDNMNEADFESLVNDLEKRFEAKTVPTKLAIPGWLNYIDGDYSHQGDAVDAWLGNNRAGTLEIATGGGKTLTSLVCASLALKDNEAAILIIAVPTLPLVKQWAEDVRAFSIEPVDTEGMGTQLICQKIRKIIKEHQVLPKHSVFIVTHDTLKSEKFKSSLIKYQSKLMLIGDEVHNLGSSSFVDDAPKNIDYRLGLSATPTRQYDQEGTNKLLDYFGAVVFSFPLEDAIGKCLVPFDYIVHKVYLNDEESNDWQEITEKINRLAWSDDIETKKIVEQLQIRRRAISESASAKIHSFKTVISQHKQIKHTLVFCTAKNPEQLVSVNHVLQSEGFLYHQVTGDETGDKALVRSIIHSFKNGEINILTSKKVLDEGFNIPPISTAFFLASSGTVRTWVQRLGRVLRKSPETGKVKAIIHDFIVFPTIEHQSFKPLIKGELMRMQWFMALAGKNHALKSAIDISNELIEIKERL